MSSIDITLRVTGQTSQGGRKYMEDAFVVAFQDSEDKKDLEYVFLGIFDGHGGKEAAQYAKANLLDNIVNLKNFWQNDDNLVLKAIRDGFLATHLAMWKEVEDWPKTPSGLPSTAGTTASVVFIRKGKLYTGHVGDSRIVIGYKEDDLDNWQAECLTQDHKPDSPLEKKRIYESGGLVMSKSGVERVVWKRPRMGHQGPIRRSTDFDKIPFLAVSRSLGDLWSYDYLHEEFVVSPIPDVGVVPLELEKDKCLILASDGLWNIMTPKEAINLIQDVEKENTKIVAKFGSSEKIHLALCNPSKMLVDCALERWNQMRMRADNTSVVTVMLDLIEPSKIRLPKVEQLVLRMSYPLYPLSKGQCLVNYRFSNSKESDENITNENNLQENLYEKSELCETTMENRLGYLHLASKLFDGEKDIQNPNRSDIDRHTSSPLQSCSNFLPEYSSSFKALKKLGTEGIENTPCPFPRWSKSASGQTSLSKLATWSKVVSRRRMSDPFPHRTLDMSNSTLSDDEYEKLNENFSLNDDIHESSHNIQLESNKTSECTSSFCTNNENDSSHLLGDKKALKSTLDHFYNIKQAIKRKYPGAEISQSYINESLHDNNWESIGSQKRKPDLVGLNTIKAMNDLQENG